MSFADDKVDERYRGRRGMIPSWQCDENVAVQIGAREVPYHVSDVDSEHALA